MTSRARLRLKTTCPTGGSATHFQEGHNFTEFVDGNLLHSGRLKNDGRGMFVKASYLFRF